MENDKVGRFWDTVYIRCFFLEIQFFSGCHYAHVYVLRPFAANVLINSDFLLTIYYCKI